MNFQNAVLLITMLYSCSVFDELINKDRFPSIYRKGLYNGEDE